MKTVSQFRILFAVLTLFFLFSNCSKDKDQIQITPTSGDWVMRIKYNIDGESMLFDTLTYQNEAGNVYSINRLQYYISGIRFEKADGTFIKSDTVIYMDARSHNPTDILLKNMPYGNYHKLKFNIGLDSAQNITGFLPNTTENLNMAWPEMMGGGYHFMKFEGNFSEAGSVFGFAMHLGKNPYLVRIELDRNFNITNGNPFVILNMNLNEWFKNPNIYDFNVDGNYSMSNDATMQKLSENGVDIFN